jgi:hypothetical protein
VILVFLAAPAGAEARPFNQTEMRMIELARDHWGEGPYCAHVTYEMVPLAAKGRAWECHMQIRAGMSWVETCTTIAHEWGHLLQWPNPWHSPNMGDLMSESPDPTKGCAAMDDRRVYRTLRAKCARKQATKRKRCVRRARSLAFG